MNLEKCFKCLERKLRAKLIYPLIDEIQKNYWEKIKKYIDSDNIKSTNELLNIFKNKRVAIIWNSPIIENSWYWEKIDDFDIVIRFNRWILDNKLNSRDTWLRTDIWCTWALDTLTSSEVRKQIMRTTKKIDMIVPFPFEKSEYKDNALNLYFLEKALLYPYKDLNKFYLDFDLFYKVSQSIVWEPTSGFSIIHYILEHTEALEIWLFWFSFSDENRICWKSYATQHNFSKESEIINDLIQKNQSRIKLY